MYRARLPYTDARPSEVQPVVRTRQLAMRRCSMIAIRGWSSSIKILALFGLILAIKFTSIATLIVYRDKCYGERCRRARLSGGEFALIANLMRSMRSGR